MHAPMSYAGLRLGMSELNTATVQSQLTAIDCRWRSVWNFSG